MNPQASFQHAKYCAYADFCTREHTRTSTYWPKKTVLLHFRTPPIVIDDSSWKNAAESFTVALTLTLGGTKVQ